MKKETLEILEKVKTSELTIEQAQKQLFVLFDVRQRFKDKQKLKWIRFADQYPIEPKKIVARHLKTPDIIGEAHYFNPDSDNARRANLYSFEWIYVE